MQTYLKRTQVATALPKRQQKADSKTQAKFADNFQKPRYAPRNTVPSSVNIMPIVNVNVNLNLSNSDNPTKGSKPAQSKEESITSKFNWGKEFASVAAAASGLSQE